MRERGWGSSVATANALFSFALTSTRMGAAGSVQKSATSTIERLRDRELDKEEELEKQRSVEEMKTEATITQLLSEKHELAGQLREAKSSLAVQTEGWKKEQNKTLALMFSDLPLNLLSGSSNFATGDASLSKRFPMVTIAKCDVVGFASLTARLQPQDIINLVDHLHAIIDEAFGEKDIFIMEQHSDGCTAASGLVETYPEERTRTGSQMSMTDSSYGSELFELESHDIVSGPAATELPKLAPVTSESKYATTQDAKASTGVDCAQRASHYAALLATASLKLMSSTTRVQVPCSLGPDRENRQLQLRIAIHSGPCSAGVIGLQTSTGMARIPHYKLFGPAVKLANNLCATGLALQIRISRQCRDFLLEAAGGFCFERCPDYTMWASRKPIESYWLVRKEDLPFKLPSLDLALPLSEYEDVEV